MNHGYRGSVKSASSATIYPIPKLIVQDQTDWQCSSKCSNQTDLHLTFIDPI